MRERECGAAAARPTCSELDLIYAVPRPLQARTIVVAALWLAALSIALALHWPRLWQRIALVDLSAMSVLFALATARQWMLRAAYYRHVRPSLSAGFARRVTVGAGWIAGLLVIMGLTAVKVQPRFIGFHGVTDAAGKERGFSVRALPEGSDARNRRSANASSPGVSSLAGNARSPAR